MTANKQTPWGASDVAKDYGNGITFHTTPSHGGFHVPADMLARMPGPLRAFRTYAGGPWYEEDCDWAIVALAFPELFSAQSISSAIKTVVGWNSDYFGTIADWLKTDEALEVCRIAAEYENSQMVAA